MNRCIVSLLQLLYERTVGSGVGVLTNLVDGMSRWGKQQSWI